MNMNVSFETSRDLLHGSAKKICVISASLPHQAMFLESLSHLCHDWSKSKSLVDNMLVFFPHKTDLLGHKKRKKNGVVK